MNKESRLSVINRPNWQTAEHEKTANFRPVKAFPSVEELDKRWTLLPDSLPKIAEKVYAVGLFAVIFRGEVVAIGSGANNARGIGTRIRQIIGNLSSGNDHFASAMIREHIDEIQIAIIDLSEYKLYREVFVKYSNKLKKAYKPPWNARQPAPSVN